MIDPDYFIIQCPLKLMTTTRQILTTLIKSSENVF